MHQVTFEVGQRVGGDYVIKKKLAQGGMGALYLAYDAALKRKVVIKALTHPFCKKKVFKRQFMREARIQANLDNPHIVQIFRAFEHEGSPCLAMQQVKGTDLNRVIKKAKAIKEKSGEKGGLSLERAVHIFLQILEGVGFAHKYRIIHGDIKPSNILLDQQGRVKVADFGIAFSLPYGKKGEEKRLPVGTPHYMSPEQILNDPVDFRTDIYSLGVTFFCMLTGEPPLGDSKKMTHLLEYHLKASLEEPKAILDGYKNIRPGVKRAILKALENDPDNRHQSCLEFSLAIKQDAPHEIYSELLRLSLLAKNEVTLVERTYLDQIAIKKGLLHDEAGAVERNIRNELGLPSLDFAHEYETAFKDLLIKGRDTEEMYLYELDRTYVKKGRLSEAEARVLKEKVRARGF